MARAIEQHTAECRDSTPPPCPVCGSDAQHIRTVTPELTRRALDEYFGGDFNVASCGDMGAYSVLRCRQCSLEYADPQHPGSSEFYEEIGKQQGYYPSTRWEWGLAIEELKNTSVGNLIEVGCGAGTFLKKAADALGCRATGIDISAAAVASCCDAGLQVYCETIEGHLCRFAVPPYDCAVAFHCLEHVENPMAFANSLFSMVRSGGLMFLSTPLSPMSFEGLWHDPLNYPPHHLTRWNEKSYIELARRLQAGLRLFSPPAGSPLRRAAQAMALSIHGTPRKLGRTQVWSGPILHPIDSVHEFVQQLHRPRVNSQPAGDVILGVFQKP